MRDKIPYLKELRVVTTVEFVPGCYEFRGTDLKGEGGIAGIYQLAGAERGSDQAGSMCDAEERVNLWGYAPANYFAVKASYAKGQDAAVEWKKLIPRAP